MGKSLYTIVLVVLALFMSACNCEGDTCNFSDETNAAIATKANQAGDKWNSAVATAKPKVDDMGPALEGAIDHGVQVMGEAAEDFNNYTDGQGQGVDLEVDISVNKENLYDCIVGEKGQERIEKCSSSVSIDD